MTLSLADIIAITGLMVTLLVPAVGLLIKIRRNDLFHLDMKVEEIQKTVDRIDAHMDEHLRDHARGVFKR